MERLLNGRYRIGQKIGDGGMAIVYRGFDTRLGRSVAIKVLREQYAADRTFVARFGREAQAIAALDHPNIINIFDVGFDDDGPAGRGFGHYFVMELIDGPNLKDVIRSRGPLPTAEIVAILAQVLGGLGYAHARALVHRDVKPQNIMLTPDGTAKVTDFGIAKGLGDATLTETGFGMGTVHYISPEQARGEPATPASDLYAVGVMLYEMLTGVLPFTGDSTVSVALKHLQEAPLSPKRLNPAVPAPLAALTLRALAKDPNERFANAREMASALADWQRWRDGRAPLVAEPRPARGGALPPRSRPPSRRTARGGVGCMTWLAGIAVLAALIALMVVGYQLSPFGEAAAQPTQEVVAVLPTLPPDPPTPTPEGEQPTSTLPAGSGLPVSASATVPASARPSAQGSARPSARPSTAPSPTVRPTQTAQPATPTTAPPTATVPPSPTVTATAALVNVPDLTGKSLAEAQAAAGELGLLVEQVGAGYSARPVGQVIEQQPTAGKRLAKGGTITVVISRGPQTIQIPDVKGQGYSQAAAALERAGFVVARRNVPSRNVPEGVVIDQDPLPANNVSPGTTITLTVSLGDVIEMPDLFGLPIDVARQRMIDAGFSVLVNGQSKEQIERENPAFFSVYPEVRDGWVISQSLPAGSFQARGATLAIAYYKAK